MPSFKTESERSKYYEAEKRADRARAQIQDCDDHDRQHGGWDRELAEAEAEMRANGG